MNNELKEQIEKYLQRNWTICPIYHIETELEEDGKIRKKPQMPEWSQFVKSPILRENLDTWFNISEGVAILTGVPSGITVLDIDVNDFPEMDKLPPTYTVKSRKGWHKYYRYTDKVSQGQNKAKDLDIRSSGGIVFAPPTKYQLPDGSFTGYEVVEDLPLAEFPVVWYLDYLQRNPTNNKNQVHNGKTNNWKNKIVNPVIDGSRNIDFTSIVGGLLIRFPVNEWESIVWTMVQDKNKLQDKPLSEIELRSIFDSIANKEISQRQNNGDETYKEGQFNPLPVSELMQRQFKDTEWLVDGLIPAEGIIAISGAPASYKTWLILDMAIKIATGDILFDKFVVNQTGVLLIDEENGERLLQKRFQKLHKSFDFPIYTISLIGFKLVDRTVEDIIAFCKKNDIKLIIFDSLVRIHSTDENDAMKMSKVFNLLKRFVKEGLTVIFTHHNRKQGILRSSNPSQDMRGSSDILASVDCHLAIDRKFKEDLITINQTKLRQQQEMKPFKINIIADDNDFKLEFAGDVDEIQSKKADIKEAVKDILGQENKPMYKKELSSALKENCVEGGYSTFKKAISEMLEKGEIFESKGEKNKTYCSLTPFEEIVVPV